MGVKRSEYIKESGSTVPQNTYISDLLGVDIDGNQGSQTSAIDDLLGLGTSSTPKQKEESKTQTYQSSPLDLLEMENSSQPQMVNLLDEQSSNLFIPIPF